MLGPANAYFLNQPDGYRDTLTALRQQILDSDKAVTEKWMYGMPFYYYHNKRFCYLWTHKKHKMPYIGFTDGGRMTHPELLSENRSRMKILLIDPAKDLPVKKIRQLLKEAVTLVK